MTEFIIKLLEKWGRDGITAREINNGSCDQFALDIEREFPDAIEHCDDNVGHYWIEYK